MGKKREQGAVARNRAALIAFGGCFVLLFLGLAITQGIGSPSVPSGDVAHVSDISDEFSNISQEQLKASIARQDPASKKLKPGSDKYEELQNKAMSELIEGTWIRGQAEEMGIEVTDKQIADELKAVKQQNFPTPTAYKAFLKKSNFTQEEVDRLVELQIFTKQLQERVAEEAPKPSSDEVSAYYEAEKETQFTSKASRDVRLVLNKDKGEVEAAKKALEKDNSPENWKKVVTKYSSDPTSKAKGGLQEGISEEFLQGPLKAAVFDGSKGELSGPVKFQENYILVEVVKVKPAEVQELAKVKAQIESTLTQEIQKQAFEEFIADFGSKWQQRTTCADGYVMEKCRNFKGGGHPVGADPACYEADPKTPPMACPAAVTPISPALPGTVTVTKPKGEPHPQRPNPGTASPEAAPALEAPVP